MINNRKSDTDFILDSTHDGIEQGGVRPLDQVVADAEKAAIIRALQEAGVMS